MVDLGLFRKKVGILYAEFDVEGNNIKSGTMVILLKNSMNIIL